MVPVSWQVHVRWHNCGLHPLIHTRLDSILVHYLDSWQGRDTGGGEPAS
jgi:hypothetical protein